MASVFTSRKAWSFQRLEKSNTAKARGIDNTIPDSLKPRARVLGEFAAYLEARGFRVTSAFRSHDLTMAIRMNNAGGDASAVATNTSAHTQARALDFGGPDGATRDPEVFAVIRDALYSDPFVAPYIQKSLIEGNHLHVQFRGDLMDQRAEEMG